MFLRFKSLLVLTTLLLIGTFSVFSQNAVDGQQTEVPQPKNDEKNNSKGKNSNVTAEQVAETSILLYGSRPRMDQIRKTTYEKGKLSIVNPDGKTEEATYERWVLRGENLEKERVRLDKEFPNAKFALVSNGEKIFGIFNDSVFVPREDAAKEFENRIWHGLEALLRYKESGSTLELIGEDKIMGVNFYVLDVKDKMERKTRFYISQKTFRVMMLEYTENNIKYKRKFYDYNVAQGTLVPFRTVLWADDKKVEEMDVQIISFGQKVEDYLFEEG